MYLFAIMPCCDDGPLGKQVLEQFDYVYNRAA
jgi:hypothetical protein